MSAPVEVVRVPTAWGAGGEEMARAAGMRLPYPTAATVRAATRAQERRDVAAALPERPLVLGGSCCAHEGAIAALTQRVGRLAVVWLDAHGDLNTPESSPSGNEWGMPLRAVVDSGAVRPEDVALVGARNLDPPEVDFIASSGLQVGEGAVARAVEGADAVYVALDGDVVEPGELDVFMPEPDGLRVAEIEAVLEEVRRRAPVVGGGFTGFVPSQLNERELPRIAAVMLGG
jgi:arginase